MEPRGGRKHRSPAPKRVKKTAVSGALGPKARVIQVHFNLPEDVWRRFQAKLPNLGYSTASEYLRDMIRVAVREALSVRTLEETERE